MKRKIIIMLQSNMKTKTFKRLYLGKKLPKIYYDFHELYFSMGIMTHTATASNREFACYKTFEASLSDSGKIVGIKKIENLISASRYNNTYTHQTFEERLTNYKINKRKRKIMLNTDVLRDKLEICFSNSFYQNDIQLLNKYMNHYGFELNIPNLLSDSIVTVRKIHKGVHYKREYHLKDFMTTFNDLFDFGVLKESLKTEETTKSIKIDSIEPITNMTSIRSIFRNSHTSCMRYMTTADVCSLFYRTFQNVQVLKISLTFNGKPYVVRTIEYTDPTSDRVFLTRMYCVTTARKKADTTLNELTNPFFYKHLANKILAAYEKQYPSKIPFIIKRQASKGIEFFDSRGYNSGEVIIQLIPKNKPISILFPYIDNIGHGFIQNNAFFLSSKTQENSTAFHNHIVSTLYEVDFRNVSNEIVNYDWFGINTPFSLKTKYK